MANPFYVAPLGGVDLSQGLSGLGAALEKTRQEKDLAAKRQQAQDLLQNGTPDQIAQFSIENPQIGQQLQQQMAYKSQATQQNMADSMQRIIAGEDPNQVFQDRINMVANAGGDPTQTVQEYQKFLNNYKDNPDAYKNIVEKAYAIKFPQQYKDFKQAQIAGQPKNEMTGTQKDYALAKQEGFSGSFIDYQRALKQDPNADLKTMQLQAQLADIQDRINTRQQKQQDVQQAKQEAANQLVGGIDSVIGEANKALGIIKDSPTLSTGVVGAISKDVPGSPAYNLRRVVDTVKANLGFDRLQQMRNASPTGGALGQVSERELNFLQSTLTQLDPNMGEKELQQNLNKVIDHYNKWKDTLMKSQQQDSSTSQSSGNSAPTYTFQGQTFSDQDIPMLAKKLGKPESVIRQYFQSQ